MDRDLIDNLKMGRVASAGAAAPTANLAPQVVTATVASNSIDLQGFHGCVLALAVGAFGDVQSGTVYIEGELQVSDDNASWAPCPDSDILLPPGDAVRTGTATGTFFQSKTTGAHDLAGTYTVGYLGIKRYVRVNIRVTGSNPTGTPVAVINIAGFPDYAPVSGNPS